MLRLIPILLAFAASGLAGAAPADTPERFARLSYVQGEMTFHGVYASPTSELPDRPLLPGDVLETTDGRAELTLGSATLRLAEDTRVTVTDLDASTARFDLAGGTLSLHLRGLFEGESFEVATPETTIALIEPGEYRVDVAPQGATELTVRYGTAEVATAAGAVRVADGQSVQLAGRDGLASLVTPPPADAFDEWVLEREVVLAEAVPPPAEDSEYYAAESLDDYGEWYDDPGYGRVWLPSYAYGGYDPFRYGYWQYTGFGYSWYNPLPWSAYTAHHGRWAYLPHLNRWSWQAERRQDMRRTVRRLDHLDRGFPDERPRAGARDTRPMVSPSRDIGQRRSAATAAASGNERRLAAEREAASQRTVERAKPRSAPAPRANTTSSRENAAAQATMRPARQSADSNSSSQASRPASNQASRSTNRSVASKVFARPQDP